MSLPIVLGTNVIVAAAVMAVAWIVHLCLGKASIADTFWGPGFAVIAWATWVCTQEHTLRSTMLLILVTIWALRLAWHITRRSLNKPEDRRYRAMRSKHPQYFWL